MKEFHRPEALYSTFPRKGGADPEATHYCPGCGHGIIHKLLGEVIDELGVGERTVLISPVGCSVFAYYYFNAGNIQAAHGRAPAVATGVKRARPDSIVISYQGDGDLAAIGGNNILQAANRGENMTVVFVNNAIYGMTGGQLAPTSPLGMKTTTTPEGREFEEYGSPMRVAELLAPLDGVSLSSRHALINAGEIIKTKKALKKAIKYQMEGKGFSLVEILSQCPTGWKVDPVESLHWVEEHMLKVFPLGTYKDEPRQRPTPPHPADYEPALIDRVIHAGTSANGRGKAHEPVRPVTLPLGIRAAGFGGQGILLLGEMLAKAGLAEGLSVTWLPSYGPEMRGGTANCSVVISDTPVGNPIVDQPNLLLALNRPSLERFEPMMQPGGVVIYDSSLIDVGPTRSDLTAIAIPATKIADELGTAKVANVVMLGACMELLAFPSQSERDPLLQSISRDEKMLEANRLALKGGMEAARAAAAPAR